MRRGVSWLCGDCPPALVGLLLIVVITMAASTRQYVAVWRSEPTLWAYAARLAPEKPRVLNNYAVTLAAQGRLQEARAWFERAHAAGHAAHLPKWDRVEGELRSRENLIAVNDLIAAVAR